MLSAASFLALAPDQRYVSSVSAITGYSSMISSQSAPTDLPTNLTGVQLALGALSGAQAASMQWFNQVYPASLSVPQDIVAQGSSISAALTELTDVAQQLAADPTNSQLAASVTSGANTLLNEVSKMQASCTTLVAGQTGFSNALVPATQAMIQATAQMQAAQCNLESDLNAQQAKLDALQHATCPNNDEIAATQAAIANDQQQLQAVTQFIDQLQNVLQGSDGAQGAVNGLSYLIATWNEIVSITQGSVTALGRVASDPATVMQLDLQQASQAWQSLLDRLSSITTQAAPILAAH